MVEAMEDLEEVKDIFGYCSYIVTESLRAVGIKHLNIIRDIRCKRHGNRKEQALCQKAHQ